MSLLGKAVRTYLTGRTGFSGNFPGGMSPEIAPAGVSLPFIVYSGANSDRLTEVSGKVLGHLETVNLVITAKTRAECETLVDWLANHIRTANGWKTVADPKVAWWRSGTQGDVAEVILDGADESIRQVTLDVIGFVVTDR